MKATKNINKILIGALSALVLTAPAFAQQKEQKKVDSLRREFVKAEQALTRTTKILGSDPKNGEKYRLAKDARVNYNRINNELEAAIKAKEEAAKKAKEDQEKAAKKAKEAKIKPIYQERFKAFELIWGVPPKMKEYIMNKLLLDPNWDIQSLSTRKDWDNNDYAGWLVYYGYARITDLKGHSEDVLLVDKWARQNGEEVVNYNMQQLQQAWECHNNPFLLYETIKKQEMKRYFANYYYGYTGEKINPRDVPSCEKIELYKLDIPKNDYYYHMQCEIKYREDSIVSHIYKIIPGTYFYYTCYTDDGQSYNIATKKNLKPENIFSREKGFFNWFKEEPEGWEFPKSREMNKPNDNRSCRQVVQEEYELEPIFDRVKLVKTFKMEDFMKK